eukprot:992483_1
MLAFLLISCFCVAIHRVSAGCQTYTNWIGGTFSACDINRIFYSAIDNMHWDWSRYECNEHHVACSAGGECGKGDFVCSNPLDDSSAQHYKALYLEVCKIHDMCYKTNRGNDPSLCDNEFYDNMIATCDQKYAGVNSAQEIDCKYTASLWHIGVSAFGVYRGAGGSGINERNCGHIMGCGDFTDAADVEGDYKNKADTGWAATVRVVRWKQDALEVHSLTDGSIIGYGEYPLDGSVQPFVTFAGVKYDLFYDASDKTIYWSSNPSDNAWVKVNTAPSGTYQNGYTDQYLIRCQAHARTTRLRLGRLGVYWLTATEMIEEEILTQL